MHNLNDAAPPATKEEWPNPMTPKTVVPESADKTPRPNHGPFPATKEVSGTELLADVMHLWVDGYISKNPNSCADDAISNAVFAAVGRYLSVEGIEVDYCGWHKTLSKSVPTPPAAPVAPTLVEPEIWLSQAANLLKLYLLGYQPKDVARDFLAKVALNWPNMLDEIEEKS